jgi:hypothetical protein
MTRVTARSRVSCEETKVRLRVGDYPAGLLFLILGSAAIFGYYLVAFL